MEKKYFYHCFVVSLLISKSVLTSLSETQKAIFFHTCKYFYLRITAIGCSINKAALFLFKHMHTLQGKDQGIKTNNE